MHFHEKSQNQMARELTNLFCWKVPDLKKKPRHYHRGFFQFARIAHILVNPLHMNLSLCMWKKIKKFEYLLNWLSQQLTSLHETSIITRLKKTQKLWEFHVGAWATMTQGLWFRQGNIEIGTSRLHICLQHLPTVMSKIKKSCYPEIYKITKRYLVNKRW